MNQQQSCCCGPVLETTSIYRKCGNPGIPVQRITIESLVRNERNSRLASRDGFSFCHTTTCPVVYFDNTQKEYIEKGDVKVRVGIKETEDPIPVCYCFGWTRKKINDEIILTGKSTAIDDIINKMKTIGCGCERNNPSGMCCLKDVKSYIATAQAHLGKK